MLKRPNTLKMHRLLQAFVECDPRNAREVRDLQADTRKVLGLIPATATKTKAKTPRSAAGTGRKAAARKSVRQPPPAARK